MTYPSAYMLALAGVLAAPAILAQTCNLNISRSAPNARFVVNSTKGTVVDKQTGLMWNRCIEGRSGVKCETGVPDNLNWGQALSRAATSTHAGYKDWRLPNSKELESLVEVACHRPALNASVFPADPSILVWSATPYADLASKAWSVNFRDGVSSNGSSRSLLSAVRLVRGGQ